MSFKKISLTNQYTRFDLLQSKSYAPVSNCISLNNFSNKNFKFKVFK
jgi:hypothetical protein